MIDDILKEARDIIALFTGHGWGRGDAVAYRDQGEIDAFVKTGPRMLNALRMLVLEIETPRAPVVTEPVVVDAPAEPDDEPDDETESQPEPKPFVAKATSKARRR